MSISEAFIADFQAEAPATKRMLEAVNLSEPDWKPHEKSMTIAQLAGHVAEIPSYANGMIMDVFNLDEAMKDWQPFVPKTAAEAVTKFDESVGIFLECYKGKDDAFMKAQWKMIMGGNPVWEEKRDLASRSMCLHHLLHHRAQLGLYLRVHGDKVPGMYGPTADGM